MEKLGCTIQDLIPIRSHGRLIDWMFGDLENTAVRNLLPLVADEVFQGLPPIFALHVGREYFRAFRSFHEAGYTHESIKPENMCLVSRNNSPGGPSLALPTVSGIFDLLEGEEALQILLCYMIAHLVSSNTNITSPTSGDPCISPHINFFNLPSCPFPREIVDRVRQRLPVISTVSPMDGHADVNALLQSRYEQISVKPIDFGRVERVFNPETHEHIPFRYFLSSCFMYELYDNDYRENSWSYAGKTANFSSIYGNLGYSKSRRDDAEALSHCLFYMLRK